MRILKPSHLGILLVLLLVLSSIVGIITMYGSKKEREQLVESEVQESTSTPQRSLEEVKREITESIREFLTSPPTYKGALLELYSYMSSEKPVMVLFWPSKCSSCSQYKSIVWDSVKAKFENITFLDYDIDSYEGSIIASKLKIPGITVVLAYNKTVYAVIYGEHLSEEYLEYFAKILTIHVEG